MVKDNYPEFVNEIVDSFYLDDDDPCWCDSGEPYKHCHKSLALQKKVPLEQIEAVIRNLSITKYCLHPLKNECSGKVIKSHSIQKSRSLSSIAKASLVYQFVLTTMSVTEYGKYESISPKKIGISKASTFSGFCEYHDRSLFLRIDNETILPDEEQSILLALRSASRERFTKELYTRIGRVVPLLQRGQVPEKQFFVREMITASVLGQKSGLNDIQTFHMKLLCIHNSQEYARISRLVIKTKSIPEIMWSTCFAPEFDFHNHELKGICNIEEPSEMITFECVSNGSDGIIQFVWLAESSDCTQFINSLLERGDIINTIVRLAFYVAENVAFSADWWDSLSVLKMKHIMRLVMANIGVNEVDRVLLLNDRKHYVDWEIDQIKKNYKTS